MIGIAQLMGSHSYIFLKLSETPFENIKSMTLCG